MVEISERREVRVRGDEATFVFVAEPDDGRLVIHEERGEERSEVCALTIADREELRGFLDGMRRALGVDDGGRVLDARREESGGAAPAPPAVGAGPAGGRGREQPTPPPPGGADGDDREAAIARARQRGQGNAFAAWTREEEQRLLREVEEGRSLDELAREHGRSRRALELRLERLRR
ncbi:hypothetical protein [Egicoccus sp. AB-alg2]|uniref:hypothetical protein n=1 Tax=Egicoccus sp. AB-alg2 TaxID=3242693 RepID=UPI00359E34C6